MPRCKPPLKKKRTTEQFLASARAVHGDRFDYSKTVYAGCHAHLTVTCRSHGDFTQMATNHLSGYGCSRCAEGRQIFHENHIPESERSEPAGIYVMEIGIGERGEELFAKLGYTSRFDDRCYKLWREGVQIWKSQLFHTTKYSGYQTERLLHAKYADRKLTPTRKFGGYTECYPVGMRQELIDAVNGEVW